MKVSKLIAELSKLPQNDEVYIRAFPLDKECDGLLGVEGINVAYFKEDERGVVLEDKENKNV